MFQLSQGTSNCCGLSGRYEDPILRNRARVIVAMGIGNQKIELAETLDSDGSWSA